MTINNLISSFENKKVLLILFKINMTRYNLTSDIKTRSRLVQVEKNTYNIKNKNYIGIVLTSLLYR